MRVLSTRCCAPLAGRGSARAPCAKDEDSLDARLLHVDTHVPEKVEALLISGENRLRATIHPSGSSRRWWRARALESRSANGGTYSMAEPLQVQSQPVQPDSELEPEQEVEMVPVIPLSELLARGGSVLLRPVTTDDEGAVVHPMARSNQLGYKSTSPAEGATEGISDPPSPVMWDGPAVALFALPGGGTAALENACPRASTCTHTNWQPARLVGISNTVCV